MAIVEFISEFERSYVLTSIYYFDNMNEMTDVRYDHFWSLPIMDHSWFTSFLVPWFHFRAPSMPWTDAFAPRGFRWCARKSCKPSATPRASQLRYWDELYEWHGQRKLVEHGYTPAKIEDETSNYRWFHGFLQYIIFSSATQPVKNNQLVAYLTWLDMIFWTLQSHR